MSGGAQDGDKASDDRAPRPTRQWRAIEAAMDGFEDFRSAQDIYESMHQSGERIGLATVYRGVQWLVEDGRVDVVKTDTGESLYRRCSATHHHHLVCRDCGRTVEIEGPAVEDWVTSVSARFGYVEVNHVIGLFGLCAGCRLSARGPAAG